MIEQSTGMGETPLIPRDYIVTTSIPSYESLEHSRSSPTADRGTFQEDFSFIVQEGLPAAYHEWILLWNTYQTALYKNDTTYVKLYKPSLDSYAYARYHTISQQRHFKKLGWTQEAQDTFDVGLPARHHAAVVPEVGSSLASSIDRWWNMGAPAAERPVSHDDIRNFYRAARQTQHGDAHEHNIVVNSRKPSGNRMALIDFSLSHWNDRKPLELFKTVLQQLLVEYEDIPPSFLKVTRTEWTRVVREQKAQMIDVAYQHACMFPKKYTDILKNLGVNTTFESPEAGLITLLGADAAYTLIHSPFSRSDAFQLKNQLAPILSSCGISHEIMLHGHTYRHTEQSPLTVMQFTGKNLDSKGIPQILNDVLGVNLEMVKAKSKPE